MFAKIFTTAIAFTWLMNHLFVQAMERNHQFSRTIQATYQTYYVPNMPISRSAFTHNRHLYTSNAMRIQAIQQKQTQLAEMSRILQMNKVQKVNTAIGSSTNEKAMHNNNGQKASTAQLRSSGREIGHISTTNMDTSLRNKLYETGNGSKPVILTDLNKTKKVGVIGTPHKKAMKSTSAGDVQISQNGAKFVPQNQKGHMMGQEYHIPNASSRHAPQTYWASPALVKAGLFIPVDRFHANHHSIDTSLQAAHHSIRPTMSSKVIRPPVNAHQHSNSQSRVQERPIENANQFKQYELFPTNNRP